MSASTQQIAFTSGTAGIRVWGAAVKAGILSAGLIQTADTGQVDWATVTAPANNETIGYEMYRFNDGLQASKPLFLKIRYWYGSPYNSGGQPGFYMSLGQGTNGAGSLTGSMQVPESPQLSYATSTTAVPCYFAGDGTHFMMLLGATNGGNSANYTPFGFVLIDRTRDASGNVNGDGFYLIRSGLNAVGYVSDGFAAGLANVPFSTSTNSQVTTWQEYLAYYNHMRVYARSNYSTSTAPGQEVATGVNGSDVAIYPLILQAGKQTFGHAMMVGYNNDFTNLAIVSATVLGTAHAYLVLKYSPTGHSNHCMLLRYE